MKIALSEGREVQAAAGAPEMATCPDCEQPVELKFTTFEGRRCYYYRHCREEPPQQAPKPEQVRGDPFLVMGSTAVEEAIESARSGDLGAIIGLAFSPLVHQALGLVDLAPGEVLEIVAPEGEEDPTVLISADPETVSRVTRGIRGHRGPVFDLSPDSEDRFRLEKNDCYIPLGVPSPWEVRMVQQVLQRTRRAYLIGGSDDEWRDILQTPGFGF